MIAPTYDANGVVDLDALPIAARRAPGDLWEMLDDAEVA